VREARRNLHSPSEVFIPPHPLHKKRMGMKKIKATKQRKATARPPAPNLATDFAYVAVWQLPCESTSHKRMCVSQNESDVGWISDWCNVSVKRGRREEKEKRVCEE
jgi:hypothetical protein